MEHELPPLPKGKYEWWDDYYDGLTLSEEPADRYKELGLYDEDQMRAYGESCARTAREEAAKERLDLEEVLATIAAQSSGIPTSTSRADCMAALAAAAIRKGA